MRITRDLLLKLAREAVKQHAGTNRSIIAAFLLGSVRPETGDPFLGGTTDVDLLFICEDMTQPRREAVKLNNEVSLDLHFEGISEYEPARKLRTDAWRAHILYDPLMLYETRHFFEYSQAILRAGFNDPANRLGRMRQFANHARSLWMDLQLGSDVPIAGDMLKYLRAVNHAAQAVAAFGGPPLTERRLLLDLPERGAACGRPELTGEIFALLGAERFDAAAARTWLPDWELAVGIAIDRKADPRLHPARLLYYSKGIEALLSGERPAAALWPLLHTWTLASAVMSEARQPAKSWLLALESLGMLGPGYADQLGRLDQCLDRLEELMEENAAANGLSNVAQIG